MSEWLKEADCKSVALCYVGSNPTRPNLVKSDKNTKVRILIYYNPAILRIIKYNSNPNTIQPTTKKIRSFGILNKFLTGAKITKIKPAKLLIKNRGYLEILFQNSFISYN